MVSTKHTVFISYRREGGFETAKFLFDSLVRDGYSVTFDIDTLRSGRFDQALLSRIDECDDFIIILSKGCFDRTVDPSFPAENDWMRRELACALRSKKNIIPIMLRGFGGFPDNLPDDIKDIQWMNGPKYDQEYIDAFYEKLKTFMKSTVSGAACHQGSKRSGAKLGVKAIVVVIFAAIIAFLWIFLKESVWSSHQDRVLEQPVGESQIAVAAKTNSCLLSTPNNGGVIIGNGVIIGGNGSGDEDLDRGLRELMAFRTKLLPQTLPGGILHGNSAECAELDSKANAWILERYSKPKEESLKALEEIKAAYQKILDRVDSAKANVGAELKQYLVPTFRTRTIEEARRDFEELSYTHQRYAEDDFYHCIDGFRARTMRSNKELLETEVAKRIQMEQREVASEIAKLKNEGWTNQRIFDERYDIMMKFHDIRSRVERDMNYLYATGEGVKCASIGEAARAALNEVKMGAYLEINPFSPLAAKNLVINGSAESPAGGRRKRCVRWSK